MTNDDDINQMGTGIQTPVQSGNLLSPQQKAQMSQYANTLMAPRQVHGIGSGLASLGDSLIGGYLANKANPGQSTGTPFWQSMGQQQPMQLNPDPQASSIFSGLFGGSSPTS